MSEGLTQITIPDFDDDDYSSTPVPFGRTVFGHPTGQESPTATHFGDRSERNYFHSRGDSATSEDSYQSAQFAFNKAVSAHVHSTHPSVTASGSSFTKKSSFASFKNAFKSGKLTEPPPVPPLDRQAYPALRNPFNRSTSSLANPHTQNTRRPSVNASPTPQQRPQTPATHTGDARHYRGMSTSKPRSHGYGRSQHSVYTDNGSDNSHGLNHGIPRLSTPPPVPRVPDEYGTPIMRVNTPTWSDEDKVALDPQTPSDYAFHAIFIRFATVAESILQVFLQQPLDIEPPIPAFLGPSSKSHDTSRFDDILRSLGHVAVKRPGIVIDSICRWRKSQSESVGGDTIRYHSGKTQNFSRGIRTQEAIAILNERKSLGSMYIMCRALIAVLQCLPKDGLDDDAGFNLEEGVFSLFKRKDLKLLSHSSNHRINADMQATLLGELASHRFISVTDRFLSELGPVASGHISKDLDTKYENVVKGLRHIRLKVWPPEAFEEGAEFMETLAKCFENAHGFRLKTTFAEMLLHLLHPIGKTAQAEVNHPLWGKAMETIYGRSKNMMTKPRYWHVAYPLAITSLCVAPHEFFLRHWLAMCEASIARLKEKPYRISAMNGIMRMIWTYLYRCHEPISTSTSKLDSLLKHFFPPNRTTIFPPEDHLDAYIYIVHFILTRYFDYGQELILSLLSEKAIASTPANIISVLGLERTNIALEAVMLSLRLVELEENSPSWPSKADFSILPDKSDYPTSSALCPATVTSKANIQELVDRCGSLVTTIATTCFKSVGRMSIFDDQWSVQHLNSQNEDMSDYVVRPHVNVTVGYPTNLAGQIGLLHTCFTSWPRLLHSSISLEEALDMLFRGLVHVEPAINTAASEALKQLSACRQHVSLVVFKFTSFLFSTTYISGDGLALHSIYEPALLSVWLATVKEWVKYVAEGTIQGTEEHHAPSVQAQLRDIEAAGFFLLSFNIQHIRVIALQLISLLGDLHTDSQHVDLTSSPDQLKATPRIVDLINDSKQPWKFVDETDSLDSSQRQRVLEKTEQATRVEFINQIARSDDEKDWPIWRAILSFFACDCMRYRRDVLMPCRELWNASVLRYHPLIASLSGINNRLPIPQTARSPGSSPRERDKIIRDNLPSIEQWHIWVKLLCCTASNAETRQPVKREHSRAPSDIGYERERMTTTRGLFRYLTPFLDSDFSIFRETAVFCISSFPSDGYTQLLEDLGAFAGRHFYENRTKMSSSPVNKRNRRQDRLYLAVAHIYQLTAQHLQEQRGMGRQDSLTIVLQFVRRTQGFLSTGDVRIDWQQQRLRRYFCGIVERLFDGLATLQSSDRFIPANMHLTLYRLCEEWCHCGVTSEKSMQRLVSMQTAATAGFIDPQQKAAAIERFQTETRLLSNAAVGAMAAVTQKAFYPPETSSASPSTASVADLSTPLDVVSTLDRIVAMLASFLDVVNDSGRKALRSLLTHRGDDDFLINDVMRRSFVTSKEPNTSNCRFFEVVADVICHSDVHIFQFGHIICLGLSNLCSTLSVTRQQAYDVLQHVHTKSGGLRSLQAFDAAVKSTAPNVFLEAQRQISEVLATQHTSEAIHVVAQCSLQLPAVYEQLAHQTSSQILRSILPWIAAVTLTDAQTSSLTPSGRTYLYHLIVMTVRYADSHPNSIQALWSTVAESDTANGQATVRFLLEQSSKIGSTGFINCAKQIVALLSRTAVGQQIIEDLCGVIEPVRMLPMIDHKLNFPGAEEMNLLADLDALFAEQPHHTLGTGQFALLFMTDIAPSRAWDFKKQLPTMLHAVLVHVDHRYIFVREHAKKLLFQTIRSWMPGYDEISDHSLFLLQFDHRKAIIKLEQDSTNVFWSEDDSQSKTHAKMKSLCLLVLQWLLPLHSRLAEQWGSLALEWGTGCSIRAIAFRSLQIFRALMPAITKADLALLLGRLSNTIADQEPNIQSFTAEIFLTLVSLAQHRELNSSLLPTMFWCAYACLSTPIQTEFSHGIEFLRCLLTRLDLDDPAIISILLSQQPSGWQDVPGLLPMLLLGMRSSATFSQAFLLIKRFAKVKDATLIDPSQNRVRDMYTLSLPWCLRCMEEKLQDESIIAFAEDIAGHAEREGYNNVARVMTSFTKNRFRTKDDFLRQAVVALRDHFAAESWKDIVSLLLGLCLNNTRWLQMTTMQVLKMLFQLHDVRAAGDKLGSELLMPLLRLLQTDLAAQALEVLDEPIVIAGGGLPARHLLRMSMHVEGAPKDGPSITDVFGSPEPSGWSVAQPDGHREICRANVMAVFDTCKVPTRPSKIDFEPEVEALADPLDSPIASDLGDMVQNLHELNTFFQDGQQKGTLPITPNHHLEARVAAILAKSSDSLVLDLPPYHTSHVDEYHIPGSHEIVDSDEESIDSEYEVDAFAFDSVTSPLSSRLKSFF